MCGISYKYIWWCERWNKTSEFYMMYFWITCQKYTKNPNQIGFWKSLTHRKVAFRATRSFMLPNVFRLMQFAFLTSCNWAHMGVFVINQLWSDPQSFTVILRARYQDGMCLLYTGRCTRLLGSHRSETTWADPASEICSLSLHSQICCDNSHPPGIWLLKGMGDGALIG